jgi:hypothetical protein
MKSSFESIGGKELENIDEFLTYSYNMPVT